MKKVLSRRNFITYSLVSGLSLLTGFSEATEAPTVIHKEADLIDVHHHILPKVYIQSLAKIGITKTNNLPFPRWNTQRSIDAMDRNGIRAAITSISSPGVYFGDTDFAITLSRRCNEFSANLVQQYPGRFGGFAILPLPDTQAALAELEYALDVLKLDGIILLSNIGGKYLGDPQFDEVYAELDRRKAIVYVHPTEPINDRFPKMNLPPSFFEFIFDTTRSVATLIERDIPGRFSNIRFIIAHAGGAAPYLAWKMSLTARISSGDGNRAVSCLKRFYYDTALSTSQYPLKLLSDLAGTGHILFGSDSPFAPEVVTSSCIWELKNQAGFNQDMLKKIFTTNATGLFPRLNV